MLLILNDTKVTYTFKVVLFHTDVHKSIWSGSRVMMSSFNNLQYMYIHIFNLDFNVKEIPHGYKFRSIISTFSKKWIS